MVPRAHPPGPQGRAPQHVRSRLRRPDRRRAPAAACPVILIWDNLNTHVSAVMRAFTDSHRDWLTVVQLPAYAPDLNPAEGAWANMKNGLSNLAARNGDQLATIVRNRPKRHQAPPALIDGFLGQTGLTLQPEPP